MLASMDVFRDRRVAPRHAAPRRSMKFEMIDGENAFRASENKIFQSVTEQSNTGRGLDGTDRKAGLVTTKFIFLPFHLAFSHFGFSIQMDAVPNLREEVIRGGWT